MTDQIPADKVRPILDEWERIKEYADWEAMDILVQDIRALLPAPPTLADMTEEERAACQWMQCDVNGFQGQLALATPYDDDGDAGLISDCGEVVWSSPGHVTPRPDLPRMTWPGEQKPAPALPEGWRLADHPDHGRVIVTNPDPDCDGEAAIIVPTPTNIDRARLEWCTPAELTYIDQEAVDAVDC